MSSYPENHSGVQAITNARQAHTAEMHGRMVKYSISMGIRLVCLILVFFVTGWLQWVVIAGAVALPYFAVVLANGGSDTSALPQSTAMLDHAPRRELSAEASPTQPKPGQSSDVLQGEIVDDEPREPST